MKTFECLFIALGSWRRKGLVHILRAMMILHQSQKTNCVLNIVGNPGTGEHSLLQPYQSLIDIGCIKMRGFCRDIEPLYVRSDVILVASYFEAMSLVMLDALRFGLPIISTPVNGSDELVLPGTNGYIVRRDSVDIAEHIQLLGENPSLVKKMGNESRKLSLQFGSKRIAQLTEYQYCDILN